jgi:hypothetical protein
MDNEKIFKTKTGYCHIQSDKIVLTRDGIIGNVAQVTVGNNIARILIIYGGLSVALLYFAFNSYQHRQIAEAILYTLVALYLVYGITNSLNNSATPIIDRNKIIDVKFKKAIIGLTRSRFEVYFQDDNGQTKKRLIMLPGSLTDGQNETEKALKIMTDENLITNR